MKDEALRLLRTDASFKIFEENITKLKNRKKHLTERGYRQNFINNAHSKVKFQQRTQGLLQRNETKIRVLQFRRQYHPADPNLKESVTKKWYLIQQQPLLNLIFKEPPIISYRKGPSLKVILVRAKIYQRRENQTTYP